MNPSPSTLHEPTAAEWIITYQSHPVRLVQNTQRVWSVCHLDDASTFASQDAALVALVDWSLHGNRKFNVRRKHLRP